MARPKRESDLTRMAMALDLSRVLWSSMPTRTGQQIRARWRVQEKSDREKIRCQARRLLRILGKLEDGYD